MKNLFFAFIFIFISGISFAIETEIDLKEDYLEYKYVTNDEGYDTCYVRVCWNVSEYIRDCTEWVEVPCETEITLEVLEAE